MIYLFLAIAGMANAISELGNHTKLNFLHRKWWSQDGWMNKNTFGDKWKNKYLDNQKYMSSIAK
mgnify:CR=1 FL=1